MLKHINFYYERIIYPLLFSYIGAGPNSIQQLLVWKVICEKHKPITVTAEQLLNCVLPDETSLL